MDYNCPSPEEFEAYRRIPRVRGYMDEHASHCEECARTLAPMKRRVMLCRGGKLVVLLVMLFAVGLGCPSPWSCHNLQTYLPIPGKRAAPRQSGPEGLALSGHDFAGEEALKIRAAFESARFYEIRKGDTLGKLVMRNYGQEYESLWQAVLDFNNHPENPKRFERRYRKPLQETELMAGDVIQLPSRDVLFLMANRTEMASVTPSTR